jgi:ligand-binding SRPBCC domain-containing protein
VEQAKLVSPPGSSTSNVAAGAGSLICISFRPLPLVPLRLEWDAYIVEFRWNDYFCDEQRRGPFRFFRHCHRVRDEIRGSIPGAVVSDAVEYELPLGPLGDLVNLLAMKRQIRALFAYRQNMLVELLSRGGG